jgi:hypothetical protein
MDRLAHLQQSVPTWLACPEVDEVVVVDWSSRNPVIHEDLPADRRIKIARVVGQEHWVLSKCCNFGIRLAAGDLVLRLDADHLVEPSFVGEHPIPASDCFYRANPNPRGMLREEDVHLAGVVYAPRSLFLAVNGYNERLLTYGCDDDDLISRLAASGAMSSFFDYRLISHVPHSDEIRTSNQVVDPTISGGWTCRLGSTYRSIEANRREMKANPWSNKDKMTRWRVFRGESYLMCDEAEGNWPTRFFRNDGLFVVDNVQDWEQLT